MLLNYKCPTVNLKKQKMYLIYVLYFKVQTSQSDNLHILRPFSLRSCKCKPDTENKFRPVLSEKKFICFML